MNIPQVSFVYEISFSAIKAKVESAFNIKDLRIVAVALAALAAFCLAVYGVIKHCSFSARWRDH